MKFSYLIALAAAFSTFNVSAQKASATLIDPNSTYFVVEDYYSMKVDGNYERFHIAGFRQAPTPGAKGMLFFLPRITVREDDIAFFRTNGTRFDPRNYPDVDVGSISIRPTYTATMPTPQQVPGIAAALEGQSLPGYRVPSWKSAGLPVMVNDALTTPWIRDAIYQDYLDYDQALNDQEKLSRAYSDYTPRNATLEDVEVSLLIGDEVAASRTYTGTSTNLGPITLMAPSEFQKNQILEGNYEVLVTSRFRDTKTSSISARFDAKLAVKSFAEQTQRAITKSKSSGFQVFGIGSRKSKMKTSINQTLKTTDIITEMENTTIVMYDADDVMIEQFESKLFPSVTEQQVIDRHLEAAAKASSEGNEDLAKVHRDYADAVQNDNQMKEVDSVAAAAALNAGDYAGFLAHGVRSLNSNDRKENSFRRLVTSEVEIEKLVSWDDTRTVTAMREISVPVIQEKVKDQRARVGLCNMRYNVDYVWIGPDPWTVTPSKGLMVTCVEANSPAHLGGLVPGMIIRAIDTDDVATFSDVENALSSVEAGEIVNFWVVKSPSPHHPVSSEQMIAVQTKRGIAK